MGYYEYDDGRIVVIVNSYGSNNYRRSEKIKNKYLAQLAISLFLPFILLFTPFYLFFVARTLIENKKRVKEILKIEFTRISLLFLPWLVVFSLFGYFTDNMILRILSAGILGYTFYKQKKTFASEDRYLRKKMKSDYAKRRRQKGMKAA